MEMMSFSGNTGGPGPIDPYGKYRVEPVGERGSNKKMSGSSGDQKPPREKFKFIAKILHLFHKAFDFFIFTHQKTYQKRGVPGKILSLKNYFEMLKKEDHSQDIKFLNDLSKIWVSLLQESGHFGSSEIDSKFLLFLKKINNYPEESSHSLGYYLSEYAGQKWIPFPYMELIQMIHRDYKKNPEESALNQWTLILQQILSLLE